jgi:protein-tyrosine phosphatase
LRAVIDLHSHLLPGIDDGPPDAAGSVAMARAAVQAGITAIAATPHIDHAHDVVVGELAERRLRLQAVLAAEGVELEVLQGGEITGARMMELGAEDLSVLTLGGGRHLLLECPFTPVGSMFEHIVFRAQSLGFDVLLGHPERSPEFAQRPARLASLIDRRVLVQVTAGSLAGHFGRTVQRATIEMLAEGLVHVIASDAHEALRRRPDLLEGLEALERLVPGVADHAEYWTEVVPAAIVDGGDVEPPPRLKPSKGRMLTKRLLRR